MHCQIGTQRFWTLPHYIKIHYKTIESESICGTQPLSQVPALENIVQGCNSEEKIPIVQKYLDIVPSIPPKKEEISPNVQ